jgi:glycosyltransferase involved in cell wall biosynthesis
MNPPRIQDLPAPPPGKTGWPWTEDTTTIPNTMPDGRPWPRVSIVTPNFNGAAFLEESIRSVLLQGYPDLEYIIMDGGSRDESVAIIRKYEPWLATFVSEPDRGQSHAINKGLALCTGLYVNWHNADDILLPGSLRDTVMGFQTYPDASYICRFHQKMDEHGTIRTKKTAPPPGPLDKVRCLVATSPGFQPGGLMRLDWVREAGGVDEHLECAMDEELMLKLLLRAPGYYIQGPGMIFREYAGQKSQALMKARVREKIRISRRIFGMLPANSPLRSYWHDSQIFAHRHGAALYAQSGYPIRAIGHRLAALAWSTSKRLMHPGQPDYRI